MTISKTAVRRMMAAVGRFRDKSGSRFRTSEHWHLHSLRLTRRVYSVQHNQRADHLIGSLVSPDDVPVVRKDASRKRLFWDKSQLRITHLCMRSIKQELTGFCLKFSRYSAHVYDVFRLGGNRIQPVPVTTLDLFCNRIVEWSIDVHFSDSQLMRYMNRVVLINQTLKDEWCAVSEDIDNPKEKLMFAFTRIIDAYHLKKRRESIRFPGLLQRAMDNLKAIYINNILFGTKLKGISIKEETEIRNINYVEAGVCMDSTPAGTVK